MKPIASVVAILIVALVVTAVNSAQPAAVVTDSMLQAAAPADWKTWRRSYDLSGFSPLNRVNRRNVRQLREVWSRPMMPGLQEAEPAVFDGIMYLANPGDVIQAIKADDGTLVWEYRRQLPPDLRNYFPVPDIRRNLAIYGRFLISATGDDYVVALDLQTGKLAWETRVLDYRKGGQQTSGPIVADGRVISGRGCEPEGGPDACVITAHDPMTGRELWRTRTIPAPGDPGDESWGTVPYEQRLHVGT